MRNINTGLPFQCISNTGNSLTRLLSLVICFHRQTPWVRTAWVECVERKVDLADQSLDMPSIELVSKSTQHKHVTSDK
jgi:hypothetical protein